MPRPSKMTPAKLARVRAARAAGKGLREAARAGGVSHETVRTIEKRSSARKTRVRATLPTESVGAGAVALGAEVAAVVGAPLPEALADVRARLAFVGALLARLVPAVELGDYPATSYVTLAKYADDLARVLAELMPQAPTNPADDPSVHEAERILLARLEGMVAAAELNTGGRAAVQ